MSEKSPSLTGLSAEEKRALLARLLREKAERAAEWRPLSYSQQAVWRTCRQAPGNPVWNEAFAFRSSQAFDLAMLEQTAQELFDRHPLLRSVYAERDGRPVQRVLPRQKIALEVVDARTWRPEDWQQRLVADALRPFDLERGPVFRLSWYKEADGGVLLANVHHIAIDLWSLGLLLGELRTLVLAQLLGGPGRLPPLAKQFQDFVAWQEQMVNGPEGEKLWRFWEQELAGPPPVLRLPTDRPRPPVSSFRGATEPLTLSRDLTGRLKTLAQEARTTLFTTLLAAFQVLLGRLSGQDDFVVGSRTAGRCRSEFEGVVGFFANPVALRANLAGDPTFRQVLARARQTVLAALAHQDYPFPLLASRLQPRPEPGRSPLFDAVFILQKPLRAGVAGEVAWTNGASALPSQSEQGVLLSLGGLRAELIPLELPVARTDLELEMIEAGETLTGWLRYSTDLFNEETARALVRQYAALLDDLAADPDREISQLTAKPGEPTILV